MPIRTSRPASTPSHICSAQHATTLAALDSSLFQFLHGFCAARPTYCIAIYWCSRLLKLSIETKRRHVHILADWQRDYKATARQPLSAHHVYSSITHCQAHPSSFSIKTTIYKQPIRLYQLFATSQPCKISRVYTTNRCTSPTIL